MKFEYTEIIECLRHLIETQDFVIIPDFGAFVMQVESAEFSPSQNIIYPPKKKIFFNSLLKHNDGLLISHVQRKLNVEFVLAQTLVNQFVQRLNVMLDTKSRADIDGIGFFYKDIHGHILFESTLNAFYLAESFGLSPVSAIVIERDETPFVKKDSENKRIVQFNAQHLYRAAVVLILVSLLFVYWWWMPFDIKGQFANVMGVKPTNKKIVSTVYPVIRQKYDVLDIPKGVEIDNKNGQMISEVPKEKMIENYAYSVIAGCFKVEQNARRLFNEYKNKGLSAKIKWNAEKQMYVVSIGQFNDKSMAVKVLNEWKVQGILKDGWIKKEE